MPTANFGLVLCTRRQAAKLSRYRLARSVGLSPETIKLLERGQVQVTARSFLALLASRELGLFAGDCPPDLFATLDARTVEMVAQNRSAFAARDEKVRTLPPIPSVQTIRALRALRKSARKSVQVPDQSPLFDEEIDRFCLAWVHARKGDQPS